MTRNYTASVGSYLSEPVIEMRTLADITFTNTTMRLHTGVGSFMVGATHYDGIGAFGGVEKVTENAESYTPSVKVWLSAVNSSVMSEAISESLFGKDVTIKRAWTNNGTLVNTPEISFIGRFGSVDIIRGDPERGNYIEATVQTKLDRKKQAAYYTPEDLALTYSGDLFFSFLPQISGQKALWGQMPTWFSLYNVSRAWPPGWTPPPGGPYGLPGGYGT